jgi:hypothetical protein
MNTIKEATIQCSKGEKKEFFKFLSVKVGTVGKKGSSDKITLLSRADDCFTSIDV